MKKSITVLGVEADGIRGVRLEEAGTDWNCIDREFWPTGAVSGDDVASGRDDGAGSSSDDGSASGPAGAVSAEERYAATVDALKDAAKRFGTSEVVLSMPLSSLLVKVSRTSVDDRDALSETADEELGTVSPFPDETPVAGMETVSETDSDLVTVFAALPEASASEIGDALDEAGVRVLRTDVTAIGWLRTLWPRIVAGRRDGDDSRTVVLMDLDDGWDIVTLDDGAPSLLRGLGPVSDPAELGREVMLSLLQAPPGKNISEIVLFSKKDPDGAVSEKLGAFAPVRFEKVEESDVWRGVDGVARRTVEGATLDVTPADWSELREESRFSRKLKMFLYAAAAGWLLLMGVVFGGPFVYDHLAERQKTICRRHARPYREVKEMRDKVRLVQRYSDHARGTLEMLKAVSDRMPAGVTLTSFNYRRGEKLTLVGDADQPTAVYDFKNALAETEIVVETEDGDDEENGGKLFGEITLTGPSKSRNGHRFSIECLFGSPEEDGQ